MHAVFLLAIATLVLGTLLSLSSHPHWFIRGWDFPRVQIVAIACVICVLHLAASRWISPSPPLMTWAIGGLTFLLVCWHGQFILPYTPLFGTQAKGTDEVVRESTDHDSHLRIVVSNVEFENDKYAMWREMVTGADPDVVIVLEPGERWGKEIEPLFAQYPHRIVQTQENWYGMMLLSRFRIESHRVRFLVQDDVPSIDATIRMDNDQSVRIIGVHPRPPEPIRDNDATARDAELILWGRELEKDRGPVIIGGDLNDVAWSQTSRLFLRTSGLLDPRWGRGLFNTFHADHWWMRFPLDHIFHSPHFTVGGIERLTHVGSDHFPILIDLQLAPTKKNEHEVLEQQRGDAEEAQERVQRAAESEELQTDPVSLGK